MVVCAVVVVVKIGVGRLVAVLWIQSWAKKFAILAKVLSPGKKYKITSNIYKMAII